MEPVHPWEFLGFRTLKNSNLSNPMFNFRVESSELRNFIASCSHNQMFNFFMDTRAMRAILSGVPFDMEVPITLEVTYTVGIPNNDEGVQIISSDVIVDIPYQVRNQIFPLAFENNVNSCSLTIQPYAGDLFQHASDVDLEIYFHWDEFESELHLLMFQLPLPVVDPFYPIQPWIYLGESRAARLSIVSKKLNITTGSEAFINSIPDQELRNRFISYKGIRIANIYVSTDDIIPGVQIKRRVAGNPSIDIQMEKVYERNGDLLYRWLQVYYRWRGDALEVVIKKREDPMPDEDEE